MSKKMLEESKITKNVAAENKLQKQEKKKKVHYKDHRKLKETQEKQLKNPVSLNSTIICTAEVLPHICNITYFDIILHCK